MAERYSYLKRLANEYHEDDSWGRNFHYKRLLWMEQVKEHFSVLKAKEGKNQRGGVDCVVISGGAVSYKKNAIEREIIIANKRKLLQAEDTPLPSGFYQQLFGEQGDFARWEQVLRNQIQLPNDAAEELRMWYHYITNY